MMIATRLRSFVGTEIVLFVSNLFFELFISIPVWDIILPIRSQCFQFFPAVNLDLIHQRPSWAFWRSTCRCVCVCFLFFYLIYLKMCPTYVRYFYFYLIFFLAHLKTSLFDILPTTKFYAYVVLSNANTFFAYPIW